MKRIISTSFVLMCLLALSSPLMAQSSAAQVKQALDEAFETHLQKVYPTKGCACNDCAHSYRNKMTITKNQTVGKTLRLWGKAGVYYRNARMGGDGAVEFYAEAVKRNGEVVITKLRWRKDRCMQFKYLIGNAN
ncbi:MAG: hypothetical protein AAFR61_17490 [Bacteroidota bacterium]